MALLAFAIGCDVDGLRELCRDVLDALTTLGSEVKGDR